MALCSKIYHTRGNGCGLIRKPFVKFSLLFILILTVISFWQSTVHEFNPSKFPIFNESKNYNDSDISPDDVEKGFVVRGPFCEIPQISAFHSSLANIIKPWQEISCSDKKMLTRIVFEPFDRDIKVKLIVDASALVDYYLQESPTCCYMTLNRTWIDQRQTEKDDDRYTLGSQNCFSNEIEIPRNVEFLFVSCKGLFGEIYKTVHAIVVPKKAHRVTKENKNEDRYSLFIFGIDSISRLNFERSFPKTKTYLEENGWYHLEGYNKMADNTFPNLMAILTGMDPDQIEKECFKSNEVPLDNCPYIWKNFSDAGYITAYEEDETEIGSFNYHKYGFTNAPTDYYTRTVMNYALKNLPIKNDGSMNYCVGNQPHAEYLFEYANHFVNMMRKSRYFKLLWLNSFSHNEVNMPSIMDDRIYRLIGEMQPHFNRTIVLFLSDHGTRFGPIRETYVGWLEERLPFFYMWLPPSFRHKYPQKVANLLTNKNRLTNPYDVHMTLQDILHLGVDNNYSMSVPSKKCPKCHSLFEEIDLNRSCEDIAIPDHYCTCSMYSQDENKSVEAKDMFIVNVVKYVIRVINEYISQSTDKLEHGAKCAVLQLKSITSIRTTTRKKNIFFKQHESIVMFKVEPSEAIFEITWSGKNITVDEISRINMYGNQSDCVTGDDHLKKLCFCITNKKQPL